MLLADQQGIGELLVVSILTQHDGRVLPDLAVPVYDYMPVSILTRPEGRVLPSAFPLPVQT